jgi:hypothetical protein
LANPIAGVSSAQQSQQAAQVSQQTPKTQTPKEASGNKGSAPTDTVNISSAGQAASQAQPAAQGQKSASDSDGGH